MTGGRREAHILFHALFNLARWEFTSSDGEFVSLDHESIKLCVLSSYSIISNIHINRCQTHQNLALGSTLYKFIVTGPLGLDPFIYRPSLKIVTLQLALSVGSRLCDDKCNGWLS